MAERRRRVWLALSVGVCSACFDFGDPAPEDPRLLDRACESSDDCKTSGKARKTTGITADSLGFELGPGGGSVTIPLRAEGGGDQVSVEVLVAGTGQVEVSSSELSASESFTLGDDHEWFPLAGVASSTSVTLRVSVTGDSRAELVDIRAHGLDHTGCSVAAVGRRRR